MKKLIRSSSFYAYRILLPLILSCTAWNMIRRTIGEAAPRLIGSSFFDQSNYATANTVAFIIYGLSKFVTSHVAKTNLFVIYIWLFVVVGVMTFLCGVFCSNESGNYMLFFITWVFNYLFMGTLWPIICIIFKKWLPDHLKGIYWSIICCCSSLGTILCNLVSVLVKGEPHYIYYACSIILFIIALISYLLFPEDTPTVAIEYKHVSDGTKQRITEKISLSEMASISLLLISVFLSALNQRVINDWGLLLFPHVIRDDQVVQYSTTAISYIEIGGIFGTLWCGWISDTYLVSRTMLCGIGSVFAGSLIYYLPYASSQFSFLAMSLLLGFFLYIPAAFSELIAIESVDTKYTNFIISMNGLMSPFGNVVSGIPVNRMIEMYGWDVVPLALCVSFLCFTVLLWLNSLVRKYSLDSKEL